MNTPNSLLIELTVLNHAGVMSHITGLFSRRGFNLEGILCGRIGDGSKSIIYLLVNRDDQLEQILHQLEKLYDVESIKVHEHFDDSVFERLGNIVGVSTSDTVS